MRRPLAYFGFSFLFSLLIVISTDVGPWFVLLLSSGLLLTAQFLRRKKTTAITMVVIAVAIAIAQLYLIVFNVVIIGREDVSNDTHNIVGVVENVRGTVYGTNILQLRIVESNSLPNNRLINITDAPEALPGQMISCDVMLIDSGADALELYSDGVFISSVYQGNLFLISDGHGITYFFKEVQQYLTQKLEPYLSSDILGVAAAMTYGDRSGLNYDIVTNFSKAGLSHILVVSGLHLSILCSLLLLLLRKLSNNRFIIYPVIIIVVILYTLLCGVRLSIVRAAFVVIMLSFSKLFKRKSDTYTSLGFAVLVITLLNPYSSIDLSLLLSLFAPLGILFANEIYIPIDNKLKSINKPLAWVASAMLTSLAAIVATMPVFAALRDGFSLLAIPANLLAVSLTTPIICLTLLALPFTFLPIPQFTALLLSIDEVLIELLIYISNFVAQIEWQFIHFSGSYPFLILVIAFIVGILNIIFDRHKLAVLSGAIVLLSGAITYSIIDYNTFHVVVVGETLNPVVVITQNNNSAVIYRGTKGNNEEIERYLAKRNIRNISTVIDISHSQTSMDLVAEDVYSFEQLGYYSDTFTIMEDIDIIIRKQSGSNVCLLDIAGYKVAIASGTADYDGYGIQDLVVAGSATQHNINAETLFSRKPSACIDFTAAELLQTEDVISVWIRPNTSYIIEG